MKKFVSKLLVLLMTVSIVVPQFMSTTASAAATITTSDGFVVGTKTLDEYDSNGKESSFTSSKVLEKYTGKGGTVVVPNGIQVIGYEAFRNRNDITNIVLPDSLLYIEIAAFENCGISSIVFPKNVKCIGTAACYTCKKLSTAIFLCKDVAMFDGIFDFTCNSGCMLYGYTGGDAWDYIANETHPANTHFKDIKYAPADLINQRNAYYATPAHGTLTLDTSSYSMSFGKTYQIGTKVTSSNTYLRVYSTNSGIASVNSSNYKVTGQGNGTAWIMFDVYDSSTNKKIGHVSTRIDVKNGTKPHGNSARQIAKF